MPELTVKFPDASYSAKFFPTDDPSDRKSGYSTVMVPGGGPAASVVNRAEMTLRISPGNYWMFVSRAGQFVERRFVRVPWGGSQLVEVGATQKNLAEVIPSSEPDIKWIERVSAGPGLFSIRATPAVA
ncbi:MAG TPA: hypothetical protein PKC45_16335, partial [Gemmatales bacterium]|nr:hypothetical protein [Gemmatales bacterium]